MSEIRRDVRRLCWSVATIALSLALTSDQNVAFAQATPAAACQDSVQGRVAWDYSGNKTWSQANLKRLCRGATQPLEPGRCFRRVMHGGISWGGSTRWQWENALDLCAGTANANRTIRCFQTRIREGEPWRDAIRACNRPPARIAQVQQPEKLRVITGMQTVATLPPPSPQSGSAQADATRTILPDGTVEVAYPDGSRARFYSGGETRISPDGTERVALYSTGARPPIPPAIPDSAEIAWLEVHSERLLGLIKSLVNYDQAAIDNYLQFEGTAGGIYDQIVKREETLGLLLRE